MSLRDVRGTDSWNRVEAFFRALHEPRFGRPSRLLEPAVTPTGDRIALTGVVLDELVGHPRRSVHLVQGGTDADAALTPVYDDQRSSFGARWSPDGQHLAMATDEEEEGVFGVAVLAADGTRTTTSVPGTLEYLAWSPDGASLLLAVAGRGADLAGAQSSGTTKRVEETLPSWYPSVDEGQSEESWRSVHVLDVAAGTVRRWSPAGCNVWEAAWLGPDAIMAVASDAPEEGAWYTATLQRIDADGATSELFSSEVQLGWPSASPDGGQVAVVDAVCSDRWVVAGDLMVGPAGGQLVRTDTHEIDVTSTRWIDDRRIGIAGQRGLETVVAVYDTATGVTTELWASTSSSCGFRYPEVAWTADGSAVFVEEGYSLAPRVVVVPPEGGAPRVVLTNDHPGTDYQLSVAGSAEAVSWTAPDGLDIEGFLCKPEGDGPFPLVVNIHGGPVWAFRNTWSMFYAYTPLLVSLGYAVLNPNPRGSAGRGQKFAREVFGEMGGADTYDFTSGVDALVERGIADPTRVGLIGGSYGGYMSSWLVTQDQRWAASVPISPVTDWYSQHFTSNIPFFDQLFLDGDPEVPGDKFHRRSPVAHASKVVTPCLNIAGALDRCTPATQAQEFHQALLEHGVDSALVIYPEEGHGVRAFPATIDYCTRVVDWFDRYMPASRPTGD